MNIDSTSAAGFVLHELTWCVRVLTAEQLQRMLDARHGSRPFPLRSLREPAGRGSRQLDAHRSRVLRGQRAHRLPVTRSTCARLRSFGLAAGKTLAERHVPSCDDLVGRHPVRPDFLVDWPTFDRHASQLEHDLGTASVLVRLHETQPGTCRPMGRRGYPPARLRATSPVDEEDPRRGACAEGQDHSSRRIRRTVLRRAPAPVPRAFLQKTPYSLRPVVDHS